MTAGRLRTRALLGVAALCIGAGAASSLLPAAAAAPADDAADAAVAWLAGESTDGIFSHLGAPDWGLTADAVLADAAAGSAGVAAARSTEQLAAHATTFITFGVPGVRSAGALAKLALVAEVMGEDPTDFGGWNLLDELTATLDLTPGPNLGRFSDVGVPDGSNVYGQALGVLALARQGGAPPEATSFLRAQQCPGGGFRAFFPAGGGCTSAAAADADTSAIAIAALVAEGSPASVTAAGLAGDELVARQRPDGSIGGSGPTAAPNANSTALAAQALGTLGRGGPAAAARNWVLGLQLGCGTPGGSDAGAVAYNPAARTAASTSGIAAGSRDQFRRTTTQAVLGLAGVPLTTLSATGIRPDSLPLGCEPASTTSTSSPSPTTTAPPTTAPATTGAPTTAAPTTAPPTTAVVTAAPPTTAGSPVTVPPTTSVASAAQAGDTDVLAGTADRASTGLAFTGGSTGTATSVGLGLVALGAALAGVALHGGRGR